VAAIPLNRRRRLLGYLIPLMNLPLFSLKAYQTYGRISAGMSLNSPEFFNDIIILGLSLSLGLLLPWWAPIYESRYGLTREGVTIKRLLRGRVTIPYKSIARSEVYLRNRSNGEVSKEALRYGKESVATLRSSGFKFSDFTNSEEVIVLLITERRIYMLSPEDPRAFLKRVRRRVEKLPIKLVELTSKGKRVREL